MSSREDADICRRRTLYVLIYDTLYVEQGQEDKALASSTHF